MSNLRNGSLASLRLVRVAFVSIFAILAGSAGSAQQDPADDDPRTLQPDQGYFSQLPFEHVDMYNGNLLLNFTDLALPGDAGMDLRLVRSYNHQNVEQKWSLGIAGVPIFIDTENDPATGLPVLVTADGGRQKMQPTDSSNSVFLAPDFSRLTAWTLEM